MGARNRKSERAAGDCAAGAGRPVIESAIFERFRAKPRGALLVGVLDEQVREWIGAETSLVHLFGRVMHKQDGRHPNPETPGHPELDWDDYRRLPRIIEQPEFVFRLAPHRPIPEETLCRRLNLVRRVDGRIYHLVVERDLTAQRVEVVSFHGIKPRKVRVRLQRAGIFRPANWKNWDWEEWDWKK